MRAGASEIDYQLPGAMMTQLARSTIETVAIYPEKARGLNVRFNPGDEIRNQSLIFPKANQRTSLS